MNFESGDDFDVGAAMAAMGVKPLGKPESVVEVRKRTPELSRVKHTPTPTHLERVNTQQNHLDSLTKKCGSLERDLVRSNGELQAAKATISLMTDENRALSDALLERPSEPVDVSTNRGEIEAILRERGLRGRQEFGAVFTTLVRSKRLFDIFSDLSTENPRAFSHLLNSNVFLHCGSVGCVVKGSVLTVPVAPERCEMCGGSGQSSPIDQMSEALMLHGFTRVAVVTGQLASAKALRAGLHKRINLTILPAGVSAALFAREHLVIDWGDHAPSSTNSESAAVLLRCKAPIVSELSKRVCSFLQKLDKR